MPQDNENLHTETEALWTVVARAWNPKEGAAPEDDAGFGRKIERIDATDRSLAFAVAGSMFERHRNCLAEGKGLEVYVRPPQRVEENRRPDELTRISSDALAEARNLALGLDTETKLKKMAELAVPYNQEEEGVNRRFDEYAMLIEDDTIKHVRMAHPPVTERTRKQRRKRQRR